MTRVRAGRRVRPGRYTLRDHDYRRHPSYRLLASASTDAGIEQQLERFHYTPGAFLFEGDRDSGTPTADDRGRYRTDEAEAAAMAQRRLEAQRAEAFSCTFESNAVDLSPGVIFGMRDHPRRDLGEDRRLLVVESTLQGEAGHHFHVEAEARSTSARFRPPLSTPKPKVNGVESATVVGPPGEEIHTDEFGRIRVHFHWDRESRMDQHSSCWIHVSQPWGGTGYGGINLPRIGQEVLVDFLGGDPDRPVIVGRLYTNLQKVPYPLPDNKTQSGWRSNSTSQTGGYNELMFEDSAGQELVRMQAEKDMSKLVKNDEEHNVGRDRTRSVGQTERVTIGQNQSITVGVNRSTHIGNIDSTVVGHTHVVMVSPPGEGGVPERCTSTVTTPHKITLKTAGGAMIILDGDKITMECANMSINVTDTLHATANLISMEGANMTLTAKNSLLAEGKLATVAGDEEATLRGPTVRVMGGEVQVTGKPIKLNC